MFPRLPARATFVVDTNFVGPEHKKCLGPGKRGHIVAATLLLKMFLGLRKLWNICCGHKMFLNKIKNNFCVLDTKFVSATNVARTGRRGNFCVGNNVSSSMRPRLPGPFLILFRNMLCPQQMFSSLRSMETQHSFFCVPRVCAPKKHHEQRMCPQQCVLVCQGLN